MLLPFNEEDVIGMTLEDARKYYSGVDIYPQVIDGEEKLPDYEMKTDRVRVEIQDNIITQIIGYW